jgi:ubiquitin carboxyl-terminal hydrolase 8
MNTSIQILLHCQIFINKLTDDPEKPITNSLYNLFNLMTNDSYDKINPIEFKLIFEKKHSDYKGKSQQDSIEFTRILLDDISIENNISKQNIIYEELNTKNKSSHELDKEFDLLYKKRENSFIVDLFYNQILNTFKCKCNHENYSLEKIIDIPLLFSNYLMSFSLEKLLDNYFKDEIFKWERECEKCHKIVDHIKIMKLTHLSKILIISFQRVNQKTGRKNNSYVEFPNNLNMKKYSEKGIPNIYSYDLFGIINHSGTMNSGHYTAIIKINNNWYEFNDSKVRKVEIRKNYIVSNLVYCLYYIKN